MTIADRIVEALLAAGVRRLFGMPGGGSIADLIEAAGRAGLPFTLAHTETAAAFMAAAQAEITGRPGACLATLGPGAASVMNGVAYAWLDRVPLLVITDCQPDAMQHQNLPQQEMFRPVTKFSGRLRREDAAAMMRRAMEALVSGPVHLDVPADVTGAPAEGAWEWAAPASVAVETPRIEARRPVALIGLGGRTAAARAMCERCRIPALVTYKAKGTVPDRHPWFAGVLTNGALERAVLGRADAFLTVGLDPVELLPRPWTYPQPMIAVDPAAVQLQSEWNEEEVAELAAAQRGRMRVGGETAPHRVVELVAEVYEGARATVDAGAHMFPVMSHWPASEPMGVLISNGLSTMGFALPAAIGAALLDSSRRVVAFTGDGGLLMCLAELRTAARERLPLRIIVFDDGELSLIRIKQLQRGYRTDGVSIGGIDWPSLGAGLGVDARVCGSEAELRAALRDSAECAGPVLIAARIDASVYPEMMRVLRGPS